eukprot:3111263-Pleurochrysis_carterae.AAC.1
MIRRKRRAGRLHKPHSAAAAVCCREPRLNGSDQSGHRAVYLASSQCIVAPRCSCRSWSGKLDTVVCMRLTFLGLLILTTASRASFSVNNPASCNCPVKPYRVRHSSSVQAAAPALPLLDCGAAAVNFFNNHRVPAALVAAATIKDAFVLQGGPEDVRKSRGWTLLRYAYLLLMVFSFSSEVTCIFVSTYAINMLQAAALDTQAVSVVAFLTRSLEFEYVSVRQSFVTGVLGFIIAQALRVRLTLRRYPDLSKCAMLQLLYTASCLLTYNNGRFITYGGYTGLVRRSIFLHMQMLLSRCDVFHPLALLSIVMFVMAIGFGFKMVGTLLLSHIDVDGDRKISINEVIAFLKVMGLAIATSCIPFFPMADSSTTKETKAVELQD